MNSYNIAIVGATGAVGEEILKVLEEMKFPVNELLPLASAKSAGGRVEFCGEEYVVKELTETTFDENEIDIAFFSAGGSVSAHFAPLAAASGAVVIDNTSHFRMQENVQLVVPECNPQDIEKWILSVLMLAHIKRLLVPGKRAWKNLLCNFSRFSHLS